MPSRVLSRAAAAAADAARRVAGASPSSSLRSLGAEVASPFAPQRSRGLSAPARVGAAARAGLAPSAPLGARHTIAAGSAPPFNARCAGRPRAMSSASGSGGPVGWKSLAMMAVTGGGVLYFFERERSRRLDSVKAGPSAGKASLGGPFELRLANENGRRWDTSELRGGYALLYFGFTMCPDICPDELEKIAECVDVVNAKMAPAKAQDAPHGDKLPLTPVFVSIDPERDTVARVAEYVKEFHPRLLGLTGTVEACKRAAKQYRVYYHKTGDDADYLVDHSIIMYLVDKNGDFVTFYGKNYEAKEMAEAIVEQMKRLG